ncbi:MAG TPA: polysaccharide biosynthesis/export family protein [Rhizomicrobium sp.]|nr:polysaccharide biosynthesis/export family protein [Rhizomicrobium sp.]
MKLRRATIAAVMALSANCAAADPSALPANATAVSSAAAQPAEYVIGPKDTLVVDVFDVPSLSGTLQVDDTGHINMPLIGQIAASGRSPNLLSREIAAALSAKYMKNPIVTVSVKEAASKTVTVDGSVAQPGVYQIGRTTTLMQAVAMAHGPDQVADIHHVAIVRAGEQGRSVAVFDLQDIRDGNTPDPLVRPNDEIVVEVSGSRKFVRDFGSVFSLLGWMHP